MKASDRCYNPLLAAFPKERPPLPPQYTRIYEQEYRLNRGRETFFTRLSGRLEEWMHRQVAKRRSGNLLEIGAGSLNHMSWERDCHHYDVVEPFKALYARSAEKGDVRRFFETIEDVPTDSRYGRIASIAALEHITDLPSVLARSALLLDDGGWFQAGIPNEGGLLWWLSWRCATGLAFWLRNRLDYAVLMRHEHINTAAEIEGLIGCLFEEVRIRRWPLPFFHFAFYTYIEARVPRLDVARSWLHTEAE